MKGHVPTPEPVVDVMVEKLFAKRSPKPTDLLLDPGCGTGPFIAGVLRYCRRLGLTPPHIQGIESDPRHLRIAERTFRDEPRVELIKADYLAADSGPADFVIGNPPYVAITGLSPEEKARYRARFQTAKGRFDLYILFFEQSLRNLKPGGRLSFITPEKFQYVATAAELRRLLATVALDEVHHLDEETFAGLVTYPMVTTLTARPPTPEQAATVRLRDGTSRRVRLPRDGTSWLPSIHTDGGEPQGTLTLGDIAERISCGVATGCDDVFVREAATLPVSLRRFARPTISGRQLPPDITRPLRTSDVMLIPYDRQGRPLSEHALGALGDYLLHPQNLRRLKARTCVSEGRKAWHEFHDNVPAAPLGRPKILCKDIADVPRFWLDGDGSIVPRHSVYYITPRAGVTVDTLLKYLNGPESAAWLLRNAQRASQGFLRLQSATLRRMPVPASLLPPLPA